MSYAPWRNFEQGLNEQRVSYWLVACLSLLLLVLAYRFAVLYALPYTLYQEESMYWDWAQHPALGYFEKPPFLAWMVALSTAMVGDTEFGVRIGSVLFYPVSAIGVYLLGKALYSPIVGALAAVLFYLSPFVGVSSVVAHSDVYLLLFWVFGLWALLQAQQTGKALYGVLLGLCLGLGLLSQSGMVFFILALGGYFYWRRDLALWRQRWCVTAALLALCLYLPCALWNLNQGLAPIGPGAKWLRLEDLPNLGEALTVFFGQFVVFGPVLFAATLLVTYKWFKRAYFAEPKEQLLACFTLLPLVLSVLMGLFGRVEANWAAASLLTGSVILAEWLLAGRRWRLLVLALVVNLGFNLVTYHYESVLRMVSVPLSSDSDVYDRLRGWDTLAEHLTELTQEHPDRELIADHKAFIAQMKFYARAVETPIHAWDPLLDRTHYYQFISPLGERAGGDFIFVAQHNVWEKISPYFDRVQSLGEIKAPVNRDTVRSYSVYLVDGFRGYQAPSIRTEDRIDDSSVEP